MAEKKVDTKTKQYIIENKLIIYLENLTSSLSHPNIK